MFLVKQKVYAANIKASQAKQYRWPSSSVPVRTEGISAYCPLVKKVYRQHKSQAEKIEAGTIMSLSSVSVAESDFTGMQTHAGAIFWSRRCVSSDINRCNPISGQTNIRQNLPDIRKKPQRCCPAVLPFRIF